MKKQNFGSNLVEMQTIVKGCQNNEKAAFAKLFTMHRAIIENVAFRILREREEVKEVVQEVFFRIFKGINNFSGKSGISTWIYRITLNESFRMLQKRSGADRQVIDIDTVENELTVDHDYLSEIVSRERSKALVKTLEQLNPDHKAMLIMFYFGSMKTEEIASVLHLPVGTVNSRIARARDALKVLLETESV
ncbi:MAG: hypothetical protein A2268_13925 [Candidatus Raymondbacteria bacterium RifOxyA12_full_50_37]|uniref:Uncharacterized protein n=1 Tax=Candidatus Raymondbacteria bacterium RIFOXYD12_FULL_49_13 TaxID=1817890 RepID=A0A1F7FKR7_UNCRA|nr:MAG: hypothetical protein A2268_13925 [Candidatus Raymondbacteria bacterium RifOxyA12_full_50_37]OGJ88177.1 MAG: hypothetical protein A2248_19265 [Candidatus Raymondbacteria bacterium RIFOXYA2_FULL_49_16]OGJ98130.1 MAG: hypothetical protein A2350_00195 [Candidatus Raymondbacteria bacterium RifOxyB12_full_50_8]OGJ98411.1 MAG: hypothetical protein A2487_02715 [Candidatus Raymondbacteria bacterium RifOxyC12_full_50_8]OGK07223.1 MAG: hypothetical protein A2519_13930 [Candidatus Raymondbacteria b